jgi:hypothetical protein
MSNRASENLLRELAFLAALDSVKTKVDTSVIPEIQDWSGAIIGEFYRAIVERPSPTAKLPFELTAIDSQPVAFRGPSTHISSGRTEYAVQTDSQFVPNLIQDNVAAWKEFVRRYQPLIADTISNAVRQKGEDSPNLIEDLIHKVLLEYRKQFYKIPKFCLENDRLLSALIRDRATYIAEEHFRIKASLARLNKVVQTRNSSNPDDKEALIEEILRLFFQTCSKDSNFERNFKIFWLYFETGLTVQEISHWRGIELTVKGVQRVLFRITRQIRAVMKDIQ